METGDTQASRPPRWTDEELERLRTLFPKRGAAAVAAELGRTSAAVYQKANVLGIRYRAPRWTAREDARLRFLWETSASLHQIAAEIGRPWKAVYHRAAFLELPFGVPQGYEYLSVAAKRAGFALRTFQRILEWAGVRIHRTRTRRLRREHPRRYVEPDDVDAAIARWNQTESVNGAARRLGVSEPTLRRWLRRIGVSETGRQRGCIWRVLSTDAERAMAERERSR